MSDSPLINSQVKSTDSNRPLKNIDLLSASDLSSEVYNEVKLAATLCQYVYDHDPHRQQNKKRELGDWVPVKKIKGEKNNDELKKEDKIKKEDKLDLPEQIVSDDRLLGRIKMNGFWGGLLGGRDKDMFNDLSKRLDIDDEGYMSRNRTGFGMMLFTRGKDEPTEMACVFEGSNPLIQILNPIPLKRWINIFGDWVLSNVTQAYLGLSPQHTFAIQIAHILNQYCNKRQIKLVFYGHSLGGGLAAAAALATNREAITFNMAGLNLFRRIAYGYKNKVHKIRNFYVKGELLSNPIYNMITLGLAPHSGIQYSMPRRKNIAPIVNQIVNHDLDNLYEFFDEETTK